MSYINFNTEISLLSTTGGCYDNEKKFDFLDIFCLCGKSCVDFHSVVVKNTVCTIRLLAKFEFPNRASNKIRLNTDMYTDIYQSVLVKIK